MSDRERLERPDDGSTTEVRVRVFRGARDLDEVEGTYRHLWSQGATPAPTLDFDWVRAWWNLHHREGSLFIVLLEGGGRPLALAPLYTRHRNASVRGLLRTVCFLGTGENDSDEVFGTNTGWLGAPEHHDELTRAVGAALHTHRRAWDRLELVNMAPDAGLAEKLSRVMEATLLAAEQRSSCNWVIDLPESLEAFIAGVAKGKTRTNLRRVLRKADSAELKYEWITSAERGLAAFEELAELHSRQWQARGKLGACASDVFCAFQREMLARYAEQGRLWLLRVTHQGKPVVVRYDIAAGRTLYAYITGVDPDFSEFNGGTLSLLKAIELATARGFEGLDMLSGNYGYKHRLASRQMPTATLDAYGRTPGSRVWLALRTLRRMVRGGG